jgi:hypothetical protein
MADMRKIKFDILHQTGNLLDIQKAFAAQARAEGWKPHEIVGFVSESMARKSLYPLAQCCEGLTEEELEALRAEYVDQLTDPAAASGPAIRAAIVNVDVPFDAMVVFMIRWAVAAIPAAIILFTVCFTLNHLYTAFLLASHPR